MIINPTIFRNNLVNLRLTKKKSLVSNIQVEKPKKETKEVDKLGLVDCISCCG